ncbi:MAG: hypothetical protein GY747_04385 [Planctomycetes bacterium]|nr:hypothetical protein [Planctomycetota bacterium]MCP4771504.1 hypothetical protein [Planctomycetota bacterium]MCP4861165.1 hypothetical protein [Planctomycetota bacterium]
MLILAPALASCTAGPLSSDQAYGPDWQLSYDQNFSSPQAMADFSYSDTRIWDWTRWDGGALGFSEGSSYQPAFRSPTTYALVKDLTVDNFIMEAEVMQTGKEYGHRDLCFFFAFESPSKFGYVHLATSPDQNAHNIFTVNEAARAPLAPVAEQGIDWGETWHVVKIQKLGRNEPIEVFFDSEPILNADGSVFGQGQVGFGSFDDSGRVRALKVWTRN